MTCIFNELLQQQHHAVVMYMYVYIIVHIAAAIPIMSYDI